MDFFPSKKDTPALGESNGLSGSAASAVTAASEQVKSKRGGYRPGGGRPRKDGTRPGVAQPAPENQKPVEAEVSEADIEFVKTIFAAGLKMLDKVETNIINGLVDSIGDPFISERRDGFLRQREITEADEEIVVNAAGALAAKYSFLSRYAPEMALVAWGCTHGLAFKGVTDDLRALAKVVKAAKAKGVDVNASPPQTN